LSARGVDAVARVVNVHASLPAGVALLRSAAILAGDAETGVSIMELVQKMDAGPVVLRKAVHIEAGDTTGSLEPRLAELGAKALIEALPGWYEREIVVEAQDESLVTYCRTLSKEDGHLRGDMKAAEAERAVRAYNPWPAAHVLYEGQRLAVWRAHVAAPEGEASGPGPGAFTIIERAPAVVFCDRPLVLDEVQREGGKRLSGRDFVNGLRGRIAARVELA
jgi:methionyl-tRNA formyltransferase